MILNKGNGGGWAGSWETTKTTAKFVQLYDIKEDPGETKNLEDAHPDVVNELVDDLANAFHDGRTSQGKKQSNDGWPFRDNGILAKFPQLKEK